MGDDAAIIELDADDDDDEVDSGTDSPYDDEDAEDKALAKDEPSVAGDVDIRWGSLL